MTGERVNYPLKMTVRFLFALGLTIVLILQSKLGSASPALQTQPTSKVTYAPGVVTSRSLCGTLVILKELRTNAQLIGIQTCRGGEILIFHQRPATLEQGYELYGAAIKKGDPVDTDLGRLSDYIVNFEGYRPMSSCSECGRALTATPMAPTLANTANPTQTATETKTQAKIPYKVISECVSSTLNIMAEALQIPDVEEYIQKTNAQYPLESSDAEIDQPMFGGIDPVEQAPLSQFVHIAVSQAITEKLRSQPDFLFMKDLEKEVIDRGIMRVFDTPDIEQACGFPGQMAWEMAVAFSERGVAINAIAIYSPAKFRVRDFENKETGFTTSGDVIEEIPNSLARARAGVEYVFLPGEAMAGVELEGSGDGMMTLEVLRNTGTVVQEMGFDEVLVDSQTKGVLNLAAGGRPMLDITASGSGQLPGLKPSRYVELAITNPTALATVTASFTVEPAAATTPAGIQNPGDTQNRASIPVQAIAGGVLVLALIAGILIFIRRGRQK